MMTANLKIWTESLDSKTSFGVTETISVNLCFKGETELLDRTHL